MKPKDVLEGLVGSLGNVTLEKSPLLYNHIQAAKAAIPVAELEHEAVELLPRLIDTARTHAMQTHSKVSGKLADEADALLTQLEALCNPQK